MAETVSQMGITNAQVCSRGIERSLFNPERRSKSLRLQWGVTEEHPVFIYVGRLAEEKNVFLALSAFARAQQQVPQAKMVLVGGGPLEKKIASQHSNVILAGVKKGEELATFYASADIFLFPSLTDTFGNVVLEAVASGLAVVSFNVAAAKALLKHETTGMLAPPANENRFCEHAIRLATKPSELSRIRENSKEICKELDWDSIAEQFLDYLITPNTKGGDDEARASLKPV